MATIPDSMTTALQLHQQGRLQEAERIYRKVLDVEPSHADALHFLGMIAAQNDRPNMAIDLMTRSIALNSNVPAFHANLGRVCKEQGKLDEAVACYRRVLELQTNSSEAHYNLGNLLQTQGKLDDALACYQATVELRPDFAEGYLKLGNALTEQGTFEDAINAYRRVLHLMPSFAEGHLCIGNVLMQQGKLDEAVDAYRIALKLKPDYADGHLNLGNVLRDQGNTDEAIACYQRALELKPDYAEAHSNLGMAYKDQGKLEQAITCHRRALDLKPDFAQGYIDLGNVFREQGKLNEAIEAYYQALRIMPSFTEAYLNLGNILNEQGIFDDALACYRRALELKPDYAEAHLNLGNTMRDQGELDEAIKWYLQAAQLKPTFAEAHLNLGAVFNSQGKLDEAIRSYRRALELNPDYSMAHSGLLYSLLLGFSDNQSIIEEHRRWNNRFALPLANFIKSHPHGREPSRRLRIGYLSPDFSNHPVGRFMRPLLESHDHDHFEIVCYSDIRKPDSNTEHCRAQADLWRDVHQFSTEQLDHTIREDRIDILVDLAMHTVGNRLLVFARKPAPVQVTYLAYPGTTGLDTIDYRITDPYLDPPGQDDPSYSEQSIRLPENYWCYQAPPVATQVNSLPALDKGYVTFGCLNNFCKVNLNALNAWIALVESTPNSRLVLHARPGSHCDHARKLISERGISVDRLELIDKMPMLKYFESYHGIDLALDPFPCGGGTTTCDALWMGVPVVTLAGRRAVGRGGLSILSNLGMPELVAQNVEQYVQIAANLASDLPGLSKIRMDLRDRMRASPLMDAPRFARNVEAAYREMWRRWCTK